MVMMGMIVLLKSFRRLFCHSLLAGWLFFLSASLAWRQRPCACDPLEDCDDLPIARNLPDCFLMRIRHERGGIVGGELFVFLVKFRIVIGLAECFLDNV